MEARQLDFEEIRQFRKGVDEFNSGKFFECHDTLEEIWRGVRGRDREFLQGLIQISVGLYHLDNRNLTGAESQLTKGLRKLGTFGDSHFGIALNQFRLEAQQWLERVRSGAILQCHVRDLPKIRFLALKDSP